MAMMRDENGCVLTCTVSNCSYNQELECRAPQITVGDDHPSCDTFTQQQQIKLAPQDAVVLNCGVDQCNFNESHACGARGITVDQHAKHADCVTFRP